MENNKQVHAIDAKKTLSFQRKLRRDRSTRSGFSTPDRIPAENVFFGLLVGLALLAGAGMSTSCGKTKPEPTPDGQDSLSVSPVMKELGDMVVSLGLTSVSESGGSSNTIKTVKYYDEMARGMIFATLNEKESTKNLLVFDNEIKDDYTGKYYYDREILEIKDNKILKSYLIPKIGSQKPDANTVWTKQYTEFLEKKADGIYKRYDYADEFSSVYLPDSSNSLIFKVFSSGQEYKVSNIEIVRR